MSYEEQRVEIPSALLCALMRPMKLFGRVIQSPDPEVMENIAVRIGIVPNGKGLTVTEWNRVIDWLDVAYSGWRGFSIHYPDGRIG